MWRIPSAVAFLLPTVIGAQARPASIPTQRPPAAIRLIREADLKRDLAFLAGDSLRGRGAGTIDEMRASVWIADEMRKIGLEPLGDFGSWFQWWNMRRTRISSVSSSVSISGRSLGLWTEITPTTNAAVDISAPTVFVTDISDTSIDVRGKVAVAVVSPPPPAAIRTTTNTYQYNYTRPALTAMGNALSQRGAAGVIVVADSIADQAFDGVAAVQSLGTYDVIGGVPRFVRNRGAAAAAGGRAAPNAAVPVLMVRRAALESLRASGQTVDIRLRAESFEYPSTNIIGVVRGTDPALRDEYVLFSSHQDHDGVRYAVAGDSIWNGADDNGTTSVALLAMARAFKQQPGKRSALFVFHGAEERGLLGSRYHVAHPVVPLEKIVAVLNGDMLGRNHPDTAALMGSQPPHRNSSALVQMAFDANAATARFVIDSLWDRPTHPEGWYFRSDHVPYAERRVPALFFSSNLHSDYHTPRDEQKTIDYVKLTRITRWMYMTGWIAANAAQRPAIDSGFVLR
jgi:Zn-dependent M28 family amino/carboxypeptidase